MTASPATKQPVETQGPALVESLRRFLNSYVTGVAVGAGEDRVKKSVTAVVRPSDDQAKNRGSLNVYVARSAPTVRPAATSLEWQRLADSHRVATMIAATLGSDISGYPALAATAERWRTACWNALNNEKRALTIMSRAGVPFILLRGLDLSLRMYHDPAIRPRTDTDVLIRPEDRIPVIKFLLHHGFTPEFSLNRRQLEHIARFRSSHVFVAPEGRAVLDLHWRPADPPWVYYLTEADVWNRAVKSCFEGINYLALSPEDLFLHLCLHAAQHAWDRLLLLVDIALLCRRYRDQLDWTEVSRRTARLHVGRSVAVAVELCRWLLHPVPLPEPAEKLAAHHARHARKLCGRILRRFAAPEPGRLKHWSIQYQCLGRRRLAWINWLLLTPTPLEISRWDLPQALRFLYRPLRIARLARKYLLPPLHIRRTAPLAPRAGLISSLLSDGVPVRMQVHGRSMTPSLPDGTEVVVEPADEYMPGDLVLYRTASGDLRIHRLVQIEPAASFAIVKADASGLAAERIPRQHLLGRVAVIGTQSGGDSPPGTLP